MNNIAYIEHGLGYVLEDKLPNCGCGGKPVVSFENDKNKFLFMEIYCQKCGITTGVCYDNNNHPENKAINKWNNAFQELSELKHKLLATSKNICLGCSGNFGKEEYY